MSSFFRAWYVFLGLGFLTFLFVSFLGQAPFALSSAVALPTQLLYRTGSNLRSIALSAADRRNVRLENEALKTELDGLSKAKRDLEIEVERLSELLEIRETQTTGAALIAPVASTSPGSILKQLMLARGDIHGVKLNMPVTTIGGLVGIVTDVTARTAAVRTITDPQSRVGITLREHGGQGIAVGMPGGRIRVINFIEDAPVQLGDTVETSSRGGLFPRGLTLGQVVEIPQRDPNKLRIEFVVMPAVDITTLLDVTLIEPQ
ncbi:MAG: rod shape-determining protein MreC [Trueperaceae bacterium]|nr:rod shape-determining protein MreC [Trueperaceae bacterium]